MTRLFKAVLTLFDGAGEGAGAAATGEGNAPAVAAQEEGKDVKVVYGKQPQGEPEANPAEQKDEPKKPSAEERKKAYNEFVNSADYKDLHTEEVQRIINRRFKETKTLEEENAKLRSVLEAEGRRYNLDASDPDAILKAIENDSSLYEDAAMKAGMTVEQYMEREKLVAANKRLEAQMQAQQQKQQVDAQVKAWMADAESVKADYPEFDLDASLQDQTFVSMLRSGVPMKHAYRVINMDRIMAESNKQTAELTEKAVVDSVRAKGARPAENGAVPRSAFVVKDDVSKLTKEDRAAIAQKAMRGERIEF